MMSIENLGNSGENATDEGFRTPEYLAAEENFVAHLAEYDKAVEENLSSWNLDKVKHNTYEAGIEMLRSLKTPESRDAFAKDYAERLGGPVQEGIYSEDDIDSRSPEFVVSKKLRHIIDNRGAKDFLLSAYMGNTADYLKATLNHEDDTSHVEELPVRALLATMSEEEKEYLGLNAERARRARVEQEFEGVFRKAPPEIYDALWLCKERTLGADKFFGKKQHLNYFLRSKSPYEQLKSAYATVAYYMSNSHFDKRAFYGNEKKSLTFAAERWADEYDDDDEANSRPLGDEKEFTTEDEKESYGETLEQLADFDMVEALPKERSVEYYDSLNRALHAMHNVYGNLHPDSMKDFIKMTAILSDETADRQFVYVTREDIDGTGLGLNGKDDVPDEIEQLIRDAASRYDDIYIVGIRMNWMYSHLDMGEDYDYSNEEDISYEAIALNPKMLSYFDGEVIYRMTELKKRLFNGDSELHITCRDKHDKIEGQYVGKYDPGKQQVQWTYVRNDEKA